MMVLTEKDGKYCYRKKKENTHKRQMESLFSNIKEKGHSTKRNTVHCTKKINDSYCQCSTDQFVRY